MTGQLETFSFVFVESDCQGILLVDMQDPHLHLYVPFVVAVKVVGDNIFTCLQVVNVRIDIVLIRIIGPNLQQIASQWYFLSTFGEFQREFNS